MNFKINAPTPLLWKEPASAQRSAPRNQNGKPGRTFAAEERDHWKFKDRDETKNRSFVMHMIK